MNRAHDSETESPSSEPPTKRPRNAFTELMQQKSPAKKMAPKPCKQIMTATPNDMRDVRNHLLPYIEHPEDHDCVVKYDDEWVLIRDKFPKSVVHLLLLCRDPARYVQHPHLAISDAAFLAKLRAEADECVKIAASELSRIVSPYSAACRERREAMTSDKPPDELPPGRDFTQDIRVGFHAHPSMNHLHLHILSKDSYSSSMKRRKNYTVFHSDAFLSLDQLPLPENDMRRDVEYQNSQYNVDYICWRCAQNFGNKFKQLKDHLEEEWLTWRKE